MGYTFFSFVQLDSPVVKKPRSKPQIHEGLNVDLLARTHQVRTFSTTVLLQIISCSILGLENPDTFLAEKDRKS